MSATSRRNFVKNSLGSLGMLLAPSGLLKTGNYENEESLFKIVCIGAHPDDPESGCGGTLAKFANAGHSVTIIYLTRGEAGIPDKTHDEAASIRTGEAIAACKILKAKPVFAGQVDGDSIVNNDWVTRIQNLLAEEAPDLVFTHWPIDSHKDHQAGSLLTIQAWVRASRKFPLYFFEVCAGEQTMTFHPTDYVDITDTREQKRLAVYCHQSQDPPGIYNCGHTLMEEFRGAASGFKAAEGFVRMVGKGQGNEAGF
jgi:LmbE family N-acetylglucosaminyl deacetylase